ncbi:MAG TPA: TolC family protein [Vicinamibacterales bacterium]|nr:TolC family protein [Vicinamibacterales bacterium]
MTRVVAVGLVVSGLSVVAHAQQPELPKQPATTGTYIDEVGGVTLDEAIARALEQEPSLRASRAQVDVTRGLREQAALRPNPAVSFFQQQEPSGSDNQTRIELQWPLDLFRKSGRVGVADREIEVAQHAAANRERALAADVRMKYGEVMAAVRALSVTEQLVAATSRQRTLITSRVEQGAAPPLDRDMLRVEVQRLEADRLLQAGVADRQLVELKRLLGMPADAPLRLREPIEELVRRDQPRPTAADESRTVATRPDVLEAAARVRVGAAQVDRAQREGRPDVSVFGMYMRMDAGFPQQGLSPTGGLAPIRSVFHYVSAGAMVTLPLQNRNQGAVAAAESDRVVANAQLEATRLTAQSEIAAARARDQRARQALDAYSGDAVRLAGQNLEVIRQTYELGRGTLLDVLNEQRRYLDVERAYTDVLREAFEARQALRAALGEVR